MLQSITLTQCSSLKHFNKSLSIFYSIYNSSTFLTGKSKIQMI